MQKYIARLIDCGFPRLTAVYICRHYKRLNRMQELAEMLCWQNSDPRFDPQKKVRKQNMEYMES